MVTRLRPLVAACSAALTHTSIAALSAQPLSAADEPHLLLPAGAFRPQDGRALPVSQWICERADADRVIAAFRARSVDLPVDYEHQILHAVDNGKPAPAAGWITDLQWDDEAGLTASVRWTAAARAALDAQEFRYWSPVFAFDPKTGRVQRLLHAGLTNTPALDLPALSLRAAARFATASDKGVESMDLATLRELLGLPADADEAAVMAAITKLKAKADDADSAVAAARAQAEPDPAQYVPISVVTDLQSHVAALRADQTAGKVAALVDEGLADGRILPGMKDWATSLGKSDIAALRSYLASAQPVAALAGTQTGGKTPPTVGDSGLTADELAVCSATGIDVAAFKAQKAALGGGK